MISSTLAPPPNRFHYPKMSQETPCIAVCMIDPKTSLCFGCGRTLPEIARWHRMESAERQAVMALLPERMADAGLPLMAARPGRD
jgi:predicted Fe-S protein YdhL (DUF1289 family)